MNNTNHKKGFTLAEVLITTAIIGIVAAIIIPAVINDIQDQEFKKLYRKAYAEMSQALIMAGNDQVLEPRDAWNDLNADNNNFKAVSRYFQLSKTCFTWAASCWLSSTDAEKYGASHNYPTDWAEAFMTKTGMVWTTMDVGASGTSDLILDTNANKGPNRFGKDRWALYFSNVTTGGCTNGCGNGAITNKLGIPADASKGNDRCPSVSKCYYRTWLLDN